MSFRTSWHFACRITHQHSPSCNVIRTNTNCHCHTQHTASGCHINCPFPPPVSYSILYKEATLVGTCTTDTQCAESAKTMSTQYSTLETMYHTSADSLTTGPCLPQGWKVCSWSHNTLPRKHAGYTQHVITNSTHTHNTCTEHK